MKKFNLIGVLLLIVALLVGCGSAQPKEPVKDGVFTTKLDGYQSQIDKVISANDELKALKVTQTKSGDNPEVTYMYIEYDGEAIGFLMVKSNDEGYIQSVCPVGSTTVKASEIDAMLAASFMALDSGLTYEDANEIAGDMVDIAVIGGDGVSKNGINYDYVKEMSGYALWGAYPAENDGESK